MPFLKYTDHYVNNKMFFNKWWPRSPGIPRAEFGHFRAFSYICNGTVVTGVL
jgi:hypothetical protein